MKHEAGGLDRPNYALGSVDNALRVMHMLRDGAPLRITTVAERLGIAASTAHRIMSMLVFHGFALRDDQRRYVAGPALGAPVLVARDVDNLLKEAAPILEDLAASLMETVNLTLRVGPHTRVLLVAGANARTRMDRSGAVHLANQTAAGRVALAHVSADQLEHLFRGPAAERAGALLDDDEFREMKRELNRTRARGYAISREEAVAGISAVAMAVSSARMRAITVAVLTPNDRFDALSADEHRLDLIRAAARALTERLEVED
jgi:DNA-binding IclR family transcriptional regulator